MNIKVKNTCEESNLYINNINWNSYEQTDKIEFINSFIKNLTNEELSSIYNKIIPTRNWTYYHTAIFKKCGGKNELIEADINEL